MASTASVQAQIEAVRSAVASTSTCTPTISATLKDLLQAKEADQDAIASKPNTKTRPTKAAAAASAREKPTATAKRGGGKATAGTGETNGLDRGIGAKEKAMLATQVINATLKALGDAVKNAPSQASRPAVNPDAVKPATQNRTKPRRSNSVPMTPLQPRSLNRVSTSPVATRPCRSTSLVSASTGCLATIECARAAFFCLRSLQASGDVVLPELQLESGMSLFVSKLVGLNLFEQATKELRILKRRLENMVPQTGAKKSKSNPASEQSSAAKTFSDLLDFPTISAPSPLLGLIITAQLQTLRILHGLKKLTHLETALPYLRQSNASSPTNLLLLSQQGAKPDRAKCANQLESLSKILLSLSPSIAPKDDATAMEPRLNPPPEAALEVQALGLTARLQSWRMSGHKGDVDKDILGPLSKCLSAFVRRNRTEPDVTFQTVSNAFHQVWERIEEMGLRPVKSSNAPLAAIYQLLATTSRDTNDITRAKKWLMKLKDLMDPQHDSVAKRFAVSAQLLALALKQSPQVDDGLVVEVLDALQGPLSGQVTELDDLLVSLCLVRKAAIHLVVSSGGSASNALLNLRKFIFQLPRFTLKWLGPPPQTTGSTKEFLRFEQRRQLLSKYLHQILDSALMLINKSLDEDSIAWDHMDPVLQDCLTLLENIGLTFQVVKSDPSSSYYVKISHLYYRQHISLRKSKTTEPSSLRALRRSISAVKERPDNEQSRALLLVKWEKLAELCRSFGRRDEAADALRSIRDHLVQQEMVSTITSKLATQPILKVWQQTPDADALSRAACSLAKIDRKATEWTWLLDEPDKATALEHDLYFIISPDSTFRQEVKLSHPTVVSLLHFHSLRQFPVRRLRTLLQLLNVNLDTGNETALIRAEAETAAENLKTTDLENDSGLARYIPHLQSLAACMFSLVDASMDHESISQALACWKSCASKSHSADELSEYIDNPAQLQTTLQSLADFARVRGLEALSVDILEVSTSISKLVATSSPDSLLSQSAALCIRHLNLGQSMKVEKILEQSRELISNPELSHESLATYHLAAAEYHLTVGNVEDADHHMVEARTAATTPSRQPLRRTSGSTRNISLANAFFLSSGLALERGDTPNALHFAKTAVKFLFCDWAKLEEMRRAVTSNDISMEDASQGETSGLDSSLNNSQVFKSEAALASAGPTFWAIVYPLFRCLLRLSSIYAHTGMYQETLYYAEQAKKVAQSTESTAYRFQSETWLALVWLMAGQSEKALDIAAELKTMIPGLEPTCAVVAALCELSRVYRDTEDGLVESALMDTAEAMVKAMNSNGSGTVTEIEGEHHLESKMAKLSIKPVSTTKAAVRMTKATRTTTRATGIPTSKRVAAAKKAKAPVQPPPPTPVVEDVQISFLRATVLQCQSMDLLSKKDWAAAMENLQAAYELSKLSTDLSQERMLMATGLIGQSLDQMGHDSVFSVIQESTLSFPSVAASLKDKSERSALIKSPPPPRKGRGAVQDSQTFTEHLRQAQEYLLEAHSIASLNGDGGLVHRVANLLQNVSILLSTTTSSRATGTGHPAHATCSIELARNLIWRRERKTLRLDSSGSKGAKPEWPMPVHHSSHDNDNRRSSLGFSIDMNKFQRDYVDIIPKSWNVVSVSMSDSQHDLCITKLQAGHSPFAIRLPLDRASSRDADSEVFPFHEGRAELLDIVRSANRTCHDARDLSQKEAKSVWWEEREALDERLRDLLTNIEQMWLGGFKGIFTQHHRRSELLARFQKSFLNMLDKHLPSRQQVRGRRTKATANPTAPPLKVSLDPRIMDLFIGLGDAAAPDCDLDEPLTDLLYFVVDILQFHGERNAYDELDFDSMVVETFDALHAYHAAAKTGTGGGHDHDEGEDGVHTILILDNALHAFPWESMPCMQGRSVSRVPSLAYLRRAILEQQPPPRHQVSTPSSTSTTSSSESEEAEDNEEDELSKSTTSSSSSHRQRHQQPKKPREGHYASIRSGTYILNPSGDLTSTAATFGGPLASALPPAWHSIEGRAPAEAEFEAALRDRDLLLYFGHGSGAQYIRARTVRQLLPRCRAAALLLGCSSAALEYVGDAAFAAYGTARHYMLAGCPAVVGTLWDVTDRDIDRFAARLFEEWGLVPRGTFGAGGRKQSATGGRGGSREGRKGKGKKRAVEGDGEEEEGQGLGQTSLVEAVARSRDACRLRYLTAAAVCVYGIPVYISK
ncbi:separin protein [Diatrype stigma]|uniref:separase n=1 Tax=Diatrype stigma TaxID=117547 RepID=A0AAN9YRU6_9PEZI